VTIEIQKPELEALILERMQSGSFQSIEDVLLQALASAPPVRKPEPGTASDFSAQTGAALVAAMQASPYREIDLEPSRGPMPVRDVSF
jgi:hypothetical protein